MNNKKDKNHLYSCVHPVFCHIENWTDDSEMHIVMEKILQETAIWESQNKGNYIGCRFPKMEVIRHEEG